MKTDSFHKAANRVAAEAGTEYMDGLAETIGEAANVFLAESDFADENGVEVQFDSVSFCYGMMIGYLSALEDL